MDQNNQPTDALAQLDGVLSSLLKHMQDSMDESAGYACKNNLDGMQTLFNLCKARAMLTNPGNVVLDNKLAQPPAR
jgi:hypothetical protein